MPFDVGLAELWAERMGLAPSDSEVVASEQPRASASRGLLHVAFDAREHALVERCVLAISASQNVEGADRIVS